MSHEDLLAYLRRTETRILTFLEASDVQRFFAPEDIRDSVLSYLLRPAKRLRPGVLLLACGSLGGESRERLAVPAAAGIELFHTWTLVHDDLIDNDDRRRGQPTVHVAAASSSAERLGLPHHRAAEYGRDVAILAGDVQHGWSVVSFIDCALQMDIEPGLVLHLVRFLQSYVLGNLICGELLDVQYGMRTGQDWSDIDEDAILRMQELKTGVLYEFAAMAGAMLGKNTADSQDRQVHSLRLFARNCGIAFQLQDDVLGVVGDERTLGKPVGSDIREGKKTVIVYEALRNADARQRKLILRTLGDRDASDGDVNSVVALFQVLGGTDRARRLAEDYIAQALPHLDVIPASTHRDLLRAWADLMLAREF